MGFFSSVFSGRGKATAIYKRGMKKANERDLEGAISEYSSLIDLAAAPADLKAMARLNRGLAYSMNRDYGRAEEDLQAVLAMRDAPAEVLETAREKLKRWKRRQGGEGTE